MKGSTICKVGSLGEVDWCQIFLSNGVNHATGVINLPDGQMLGIIEYYGGNYHEYSHQLVKMDANGEPVWIKNLAQQDTVANEEGMYLDLTPTEITWFGSCFKPSLKPYFIKTDTAGEELWNLDWPVGFGGIAGRSNL